MAKLHDTKFICNISDHPEMVEALAALTAFHKMSDEKREFLKAQVDSLNKQNDAAWLVIWDTAQGLGLIDKDLPRKEYGMELADNRKQLFIKPVNQSGGIQIDLGEILGRLMGKGGDDE